MPWLTYMTNTYLREILVTSGAVAAAFILYQMLFWWLKRWAEKKKKFVPVILRQTIYFPGLFLMIVLSLWLTIDIASPQIEKKTLLLLRHGVKILWICAGAFLFSRLISLSGKIALRTFVTEQLMNYSHRKARTKFELIVRILNVLIFIATLSLVLMTFKSVRQVGSTLLASAGVLGLIIGFAAQKSLGALFAGVQVAIAQPIRIGDTVIVEGQYGVIGEVTLTYVVVNTWDGKRLIVPINYFLENTFENWTRSSPDIIGKMTFHADYSVPVDELREEFERLVTGSPLWDGRASNLVVISAGEKTIELRGIMSARNSGDAFDLQCLVREKMIEFMRINYPECLPKQRLVQAERIQGGA